MTFRIILSLLLSITVFINGKNGVDCDHREPLMARNGDIADAGSIFSHKIESFSRTRPEGKSLYYIRSGPDGEYQSSLSNVPDDTININNEYETAPEEIQFSSTTRSGPDNAFTDNNVESKPNNDEYNSEINNNLISPPPEPQFNNPNFIRKEPEAINNNIDNINARPDGAYNKNNNLKIQPDYGPNNIYPPTGTEDFYMNLGRTQPGNYLTRIKYTRTQPDNNNYNYKVVRSKTYQIYNPIQSRPNVGGTRQSNVYRTRQNIISTVPGYHINNVYNSRSDDGFNTNDNNIVNSVPNYVYNNNNNNNNMVRSHSNEPYSNIFSRTRLGEVSNINYGRPVPEDPISNDNIRFKPDDSNNNFVRFVPAKSDFKIFRSGPEDLPNNNNIVRPSPDDPSKIHYGSKPDGEPKFNNLGRYIPDAPYIGNYFRSRPEDSYSKIINLANPVQDNPHVNNYYRSRPHDISSKNNNFLRSTPDFSHNRNFLRSRPDAINDIFSKKHLRSTLDEELDGEFQLTKSIDDVFSNDHISHKIKPTDKGYEKYNNYDNKIMPLRSDPYDYTTEYIDFIKSSPYGINYKDLLFNDRPEYDYVNDNNNSVRSRPDNDYVALLRNDNFFRSRQYDDYSNDNSNVMPYRPDDYIVENSNLVRSRPYDMYHSNNHNFFRSRPDDFFANDEINVARSKPYDLYNNDYNNFARSKPDDAFDNYYVRSRPDDYNDDYNIQDRFSAVPSQGRFGFA